MGEITIKARIPKELEGSEKEIERILKKSVENLIRKLEILKKTRECSKQKNHGKSLRLKCMKIFLDSNIFIEHFKGNKKATAFL